MSDYSTVRAAKPFDVTAYLEREDDDRFGSNLTKLFMPGFAIFALYLLVASAALYPMFSLPLRDFLENNLAARNILGFLTLLFFVVLSGAKDVHYLHVLGFTVFIYIWFVMTTKLSLGYWIFTISILGILYSLQLYKQTKSIRHKEKKVITEIEYIGTGIGFLATVVGFVTHILSKMDKHGNAFRFAHYFNGKYD